MASTTVTSAGHLVIRLRGISDSVTQAMAVYQAIVQGATRIQANETANGATISRGCSAEIRR